jgi:hypothetical protein
VLASCHVCCLHYMLLPTPERGNHAWLHSAYVTRMWYAQWRREEWPPIERADSDILPGDWESSCDRLAYGIMGGAKSSTCAVQTSRWRYTNQGKTSAPQPPNNNATLHVKSESTLHALLHKLRTICGAKIFNILFLVQCFQFLYNGDPTAYQEFHSPPPFSFCVCLLFNDAVTTPLLNFVCKKIFL